MSSGSILSSVPRAGVKTLLNGMGPKIGLSCSGHANGLLREQSSRSPTDVGHADYWLGVLGSECSLRDPSAILVSVGMTIYLLWLVAIGSHGAFAATYGIRCLLDLLRVYRLTTHWLQSFNNSRSQRVDFIAPGLTLSVVALAFDFRTYFSAVPAGPVNKSRKMQILL